VNQHRIRPPIELSSGGDVVFFCCNGGGGGSMRTAPPGGGGGGSGHTSDLVSDETRPTSLVPVLGARVLVGRFGFVSSDYTSAFLVGIRAPV
jgi:hypothetical protein